MSIARHHNEWLQLVDISGPFLSLPVLIRVFPQQLDILDQGVSRDARLAFAEWEDTQSDPAIHTAWLEFVLKHVLQYSADTLLQGQALPPGLDVRVAEHGETLRPTYAIKRTEDVLPAMLVVSYLPSQRLDSVVPDAPWRTASPSTRMMTLLHGTGVGLGLITNGSDWQLVVAKAGETTTFVTWDAALWTEEPLTLRAFSALLGVKRAFGVPEPERLIAMLAESALNQQEVTDQLGYQVRKAVEVLVQAMDHINQDEQGQLLSGIGEKQLYEAALTVMMRLVFVFTAEERGLLLMGDPLWDRHYSLAALRDQLREVPDENLLTYRHDAWSRLLATFRAIFDGIEHDQMRLPAYGGALFDPDRFPFLEGRGPGTAWRTEVAHPLPINNRTVLHLLESLQYLEMRLPGGGSEPRRLSFRALDIEQIGHVYEGLLDHTAKRATSTVLGLRGSSGVDLERELSVLEAKLLEGEDQLIESLKEATGRQAAAIRRDLNRPEPPNALALQAVCAGHAGLYARIAGFSHLIRDDSSGSPVVIHTGSVYVTKGNDRRSTGTHYTPRSLTEQVIKTTLDPLVYSGVDSGAEPTRENLKSPTEILAVKVCDPACGSGAFLVQACRYLAERLVEAWGSSEATSGGAPLRVPEAIPAGANHTEQLLPADPEERLALARRLVAERCLYGVDVNPMAVEMAKLSLWLITLHKHRPFTFLDHAIKCGDSLLGLHTSEQIEHFHLIPSRANTRMMDYIRDECRKLLSKAREKREQLERFTVLDIKDAELKGRLHREAEDALSMVRLIADLLVGAGLATASSTESRSHNLLDAKLEELLLDVGGYLTPENQARVSDDSEYLSPLKQKAAALLSANGERAPRKPFHWVIEFPEIFLLAERPGFDAVVGNPPFVGGQKITGLFGTDYRDYLVLYHADGRRGSADLCAYFFLRASGIVRVGGNFGLLAVNTIAEGDTRQVGLEALLRHDFAIFSATPNFQWPGAAAVAASAVQVHRGAWQGSFRLNGQSVSTISAFLSSEDEWSPIPLKANQGKSFQGSIVLGMGFAVSEELARQLISNDSKNAEVLFQYINGEDLNTHPQQLASRWVINFWDWPLTRNGPGTWATASVLQKEGWLRDGSVPDDYPERVAQDFPEVLEIVQRLVMPERQRKKEGGDYVLRKPLPQRWWHFAEKRPALYHAIGRGASFAKHPEGWEGFSRLSRVFVICRVTKFVAPAVCTPSQVFSDRTVVFASESFGLFALLCSSINEAWVRKNASSFETRLTYTPSDVFETLPIPLAWSDEIIERGAIFFEKRSEYCASNAVGLTDFYNEFHSPENQSESIRMLRTIFSEIDRELMVAFQWQDMDMSHDFREVPYLPSGDRIRFTISEDSRIELLRRLAMLNRERHSEEMADVSTVPTSGVRSARRRGRAQSADELQAALFDGLQNE